MKNYNQWFLFQVLIEKQLAVLHDEFPLLLKAQEIDDMARMFDLVSKLGDSFGSMRDTLQSHIVTEGSTAIAQNKDVCSNVSLKWFAKIE